MSPRLLLSVIVLMGAALGGCSSAPHTKAPVEERATPARPASAASAPASAPVADAKPAAPVDSNASKPGYYTVKAGDTLIRIALDNGQNWRDVVRWNSIENPNVIEVGQVLRVLPPGVDASAVAARGVAPARADARPLDAKPPAGAASGVAGAASVPASTASAPIVPPPAPAPPREGDDDLNWAWPAAGGVSSPFEEGRSKGVAILGKAGDPVFAAADGRVVYAGSGLRGYGNLVIVKHNNTYLTAYAHNQTLLVKEDQPVRRGQKIAEMGSSDADRVQLHFEIRRQGKPIDPTKLLPPR